MVQKYNPISRFAFSYERINSYFNSFDIHLEMYGVMQLKERFIKTRNLWIFVVLFSRMVRFIQGP